MSWMLRDSMKTGRCSIMIKRFEISREQDLGYQEIWEMRTSRVLSALRQLVSGRHVNSTPYFSAAKPALSVYYTSPWQQHILFPTGWTFFSVMVRRFFRCDDRTSCFGIVEKTVTSGLRKILLPFLSSETMPFGIHREAYAIRRDSVSGVQKATRSLPTKDSYIPFCVSRQRGHFSEEFSYAF